MTQKNNILAQSSKEFHTLTSEEIHELTGILDPSDPFLVLSKLPNPDSRIYPLTLDCFLLILRFYREWALDQQKKSELGGSTALFSNQSKRLFKKMSEVMSSSSFKDIDFIIKLMTGEIMSRLVTIHKELTDLTAEAYLNHPEYMSFKRDFKNPIDFDIFLCTIIESQILNLFLSDTVTNPGDHTCNLEEILNKLSSLYSRVELLNHIQPDQFLFVDGYLDIYKNSKKHCVLKITDEVIKNVFKISHLIDKHPSYEVLTLPKDLTVDDLILPEKTLSDIKRLCTQHLKLLNDNKKNRLTFLFTGEPGTGKTHLAKSISNLLGMKIINVNLGDYDHDDNIPEKISSLMTRAEAKNYLLLFDECEDLVGYNPFRGTSDSWVKKIFDSFKGVAIFTTNYRVPMGFDRRVNYLVELEKPDAKARALILVKEINKLKLAGFIKEAPTDNSILEDIARSFPLSGGYYSQVLKLAASMSVTSDIITEKSLRDSFTHVMSSITQSHQSGEQTSKIQLVDVKLTPALQEESETFLEYARAILIKEVTNPLLPKGASALFTGPPGTGKTIMAEALANELGLLFQKVSPSNFLDKYVGGTEKNIKKIFKDAEKNKHLLFIDEAEGLFLDRQGSEKSWERTQVDELLQQVESFKGVLIIATNHKEMIDEAFCRRFLFHFNFELPDSKTRRDIWNTWSSELNLTPDEVQQLARDYELSGGEIRNVAVQMTIRGKKKGFSHLQDLCEQALRNKTGRSRRKLGLQ
jgi:SpoVK/Ycf46/Vps4 family AAA+-type ATPase